MYKVYPEGFDPIVAIGLPTDGYLKLGISWTEDDVKRARELEKEAVILNSPIVGRWYEIYTCSEYMGSSD